MGAEFLVNSALFCIFLFFCARTSNSYVCISMFSRAQLLSVMLREGEGGWTGRGGGGGGRCGREANFKSP